MTGERWGFALVAGIVLVLLVSSVSVVANPDIMYESERFMLNEWNQDDLAQLADEAGYAIRILVEEGKCKGLPENRDVGCKGKDWTPPVYQFINCNNYTFSAAEKQINIDLNSIGIRFETDEFKISIGRYTSHSSDYDIRIFLGENFDLESTKQMIENELKKLGLVDESFSLKLNEIEYDPIYLLENSRTGYTDTNTIIIISVIIIIVVLVIILAYRKK